jgi:hypothetical protein
MDRGNDNFVFLFKRDSMKYGNLNRFGIVALTASNLEINDKDPYTG